MKWGTLLAVAVAVLASGCAAFNRNDADMGLGDHAPRVATDLEDLVVHPDRSYDAIVIGIVDEYLDSDSLATSEDLSALAAEGVPEVFLDVATGFVEYRIDAETVLLDHGDILSEGEFILRRYGGELEGTPDPNEDWTDAGYPLELPGQRYLYFLVEDKNAPGVYVSFASQRSRIVLGDYIAYSDGARSPVQFATGTPAGAFVTALKTQIATSYATPTP